MARTAAQRHANAQAHKSLAQTRTVMRYLDARELRKEATLTIAAVDEAMPQLEADFVRVAKAYSQRKGYTRADWLNDGVSPKVLDQAGILT